MRLPIVLLLAALLSSGCAGILHGTNDTVSVNSMEDDTIIYVNSTPRGRNTAIAQLKRGDAHTITASKEGCRNVTVETTQSFDTVAIGDFFRFRVLSIPIDLVSGAAWKTDQAIVTLSPICPRRTLLAPVVPVPARPQPARVPTREETWEEASKPEHLGALAPPQTEPPIRAQQRRCRDESTTDRVGFPICPDGRASGMHAGQPSRSLGRDDRGRARPVAAMRPEDRFDRPRDRKLPAVGRHGRGHPAYAVGCSSGTATSMDRRFGNSTTFSGISTVRW